MKSITSNYKQTFQPSVPPELTQPGLTYIFMLTDSTLILTPADINTVKVLTLNITDEHDNSASCPVLYTIEGYHHLNYLIGERDS